MATEDILSSLDKHRELQTTVTPDNYIDLLTKVIFLSSSDMMEYIQRGIQEMENRGRDLEGCRSCCRCFYGVVNF